MFSRFIKSSWVAVILGVATLLVILNTIFNSSSFQKSKLTIQKKYSEAEEWQAPDTSELFSDRANNLTLYGRELITHTSRWLGPRGLSDHLTNGMECQNCHLNAGTKNFGNPFSAVAATYPRYSGRSNQKESIESRINDCMQRSLNGAPLNVDSKEMKAMVAYIKWVGKDVPEGLRPKGAGTQSLKFISRAADSLKGKIIYMTHCLRCHGQNGEGVLKNDSSGFIYPPLWNERSYNVSAGMYTLSKLAGFIKNNMPFGTDWKSPLLSDEQSWDVAAFINSQVRPRKRFEKDWPDISRKTFDYPFGPYSDTFSEEQHKLGPFEPIIHMETITKRK